MSMHFGIYSYTMTVLIFTGLAVLLYLAMLLYFSQRSAKLPAEYWKAIGAVMVIGLLFTAPAEWLALKWRTWTYNPERTLDSIILGAEIETYLFTLLVSLVVALATLVYARREDRKRLSK